MEQIATILDPDRGNALFTMPNALINPDLRGYPDCEEEHLRLAFEGMTKDGPPPANLCLHLNEVDQLNHAPTIKFDIDSIHGFPTSLAMVKNGFSWCSAPSRIQNLRGNVHLNLRFQGYIK